MSVIILVGTETGNSLDYAERLYDDLERLGVESELFLMNDFPLERLLEEDITNIIFVCSTTGDGEEPQNMKKFMKFLLRADLPGNIFTGINFGVFGLGDSSYEKFNFVSKRVYRRMLQLGANDLVGFRGEGDERDLKGIEGGWIKWWNVLSEKIKSKVSIGKVYNEFEPLPPRNVLVTCAFKAAQSDESFAKECELISCERVTPLNHFQDTRLLKFKLENDFNIQPGDILNLKPSNDLKEVDELIQLMGWNGELFVYGINGRNFISSPGFPMTLKSFIMNWIDFTRIPSRFVFKTLASLCSLSAAEYSQLHFEKLLEISTDESEYLEYVWKPKRNYFEIIKDFQPTLKFEIERILQVFPIIKPRQFSIANYEKEDLDLLIALIKEELPLGRGFREGLFSKWIQSITLPLKLKYTISHGSLNYSIISSKSNETIAKIFLFATGTGIAPIRSIIRDLIKDSSLKKEIYLYFGFRSKENDFYFENEWQDLERNTNIKFKIFSQGSRDPIDGLKGKKVYIDELIKLNSDPLTSLSSPEGICCIVAGNSRLNKLIQNTLIQVWGNEKGKKWLDYLKKYNQYQSETWS